MTEPTLNEALATAGYSHRKAPRERNLTGDCHDIYRGNTLVETLNANDCWAWLREVR